MKDVRYKARMIRAFIGLGMIVSLLVMLTGCWPFNTFPVAYFTASPLSGPAPLSVAFSAMLSEDPDGFIVKWEWDFGDGNSKVGESVTHTYNTPGTYDVTLRVTDDDSATATASKGRLPLPLPRNRAELVPDRQRASRPRL
ncbi:PKD domain-containing protein [Candidatus Bipolaricaulota bacterium]|nr:PKD domain-containing protein [Candidatus Bipolaricaulota bacterium]